MKRLEDLVGKMVTVYTDGGWEASGIVSSADMTGLALENGDLLYMIFKDKISCILEDLEIQEQVENYPKSVKLSTKKDDSFPMNHIAYEESSMSLPENLLGDTYSSLETDDFSISFPGGKDADASIKFGVTQNDPNDKDK